MAGVLAIPSAAYAVTTITIDFSSAGYTVAAGSPAGQNGWIASGLPFDYRLVENSDFPSAGLGAGRSLRVSNGTAVVGNPFLRSPQIEQAGEIGQPGAVGNTFTGTYTIASATGAVQPGLLFDVPLDASSRYGGVMNFRETAAGLEIGSYWVPPNAPNINNSSWRSEIFATVDPTVPHRIKVQALFRAGDSDVVSVWIDDVLVSGCTGITTWEYYYDIGGIAVTDRTVNELTFRRTTSAPTGTGFGYLTGLPFEPTTLGFGFLFSDIGYVISNSALPGPSNPPVPDPSVSSVTDVPLTITPSSAVVGDTVSVSADGFTPDEDVAVVQYPEASLVEWVTADSDGHVDAAVPIAAATTPGTHQLELEGVASRCVANASFAVAAADAPTPTAAPTATPTASSTPTRSPTPIRSPSPSPSNTEAPPTAADPDELAPTGGGPLVGVIVAAVATALGATVLALRTRLRARGDR